MEKTVKPFETKEITAKDFFSLTYSTRELFTDEKIDSMKKRIESLMNNSNVEFFENSGVVFYCNSFVENGMKFTVINDLKDYTLSSEGNLWKFGFVNRKNGHITLLFGGNFVANGRKEAFKYFQIAKIVTTNKFANSEDLVAFAFKD